MRHKVTVEVTDDVDDKVDDTVTEGQRETDEHPEEVPVSEEDTDPVALKHEVAETDAAIDVATGDGDRDTELETLDEPELDWHTVALPEKLVEGHVVAVTVGALVVAKGHEEGELESVPMAELEALAHFEALTDLVGLTVGESVSDGDEVELIDAVEHELGDGVVVRHCVTLEVVL